MAGTRNNGTEKAASSPEGTGAGIIRVAGNKEHDPGQSKDDEHHKYKGLFLKIKAYKNPVTAGVRDF